MKTGKDKKALDKLYRRRNRYDLQPDFQREKVWSKDKKQKLLDTILKNWDIPKIYLNVVDKENFELIDGQQRFVTIYEFYGNSLTLSKKYSGEYGGLYYEDLPDEIKDIFDDYEFDLVLIYDATDEELKELFARLQLGTPLNSAEKLNATPGNMRDFVKELSSHDFFKTSVPIPDKRYIFQAVCAQIVLLEEEGIKNVKFQNLADFYERNRNYNKKGENGKKIKRILDYMFQIFDSKTVAFRNRASIISFYLLLSVLIDKDILLTAEWGKRLKKFYVDFQINLKNEVEKGVDAEDAELIIYQSRVNQAADSKDSIKDRHNILKKRLLTFDSKFNQFFEDMESQIEITEYKTKEIIKEKAENCLSLISEINKISKTNHGQEVFKLTDNFVESAVIISQITDTKSKFKSFIDALYKIIYESTGNLKRIPKELLHDDAVYFDIKHIRSDFYHDIEHGQASKIQKKQEIISNVYYKYLEKKSFTEIINEELPSFQLDLLNEIINELGRLKDKL